MGKAERILSRALGFYHSKGLVRSWKLAQKFAGVDGRVGSLPDVVDARLNTEPGDVPWERYFTTRSAEYVGYTKRRTRILIVAHEVGPMARLAGAVKAYSFHFKDKTRERRGGRISYDEFYALESGKHGEVEIVDLDAYFRRYQYPFIQELRATQAYRDPLVRARLGKKWENYLKRHLRFAREWHLEQLGTDPENRYNLSGWGIYLNRRREAHLNYSEIGSDPPLITMAAADNCPYGTTPTDEERYASHGRRLIWPLERDGLPIAHLLSISQLSHTRFHGESCGNLVCDVGGHGWWSGVRFIGIRGSDPVTDNKEGLTSLWSNFSELWPKLLVSNTSRETPVLYQLVKRGDQWFTEEKGDMCFVVTSIEPAGEEKTFRVSTTGHPVFFRHEIDQVVAYTPDGANAYHFPDFHERARIEYRDGDAEFHVAPIQFYKVKVDLSQRMLTTEELENDLELAEELTNV